jgi:hypothetical protein
MVIGPASDDQRLLQHRLHFRDQRARHGVGRAAGGIAEDQLDRLRRPALGERGDRQRHAAGDRGKAQS